MIHKVSGIPLILFLCTSIAMKDSKRFVPQSSFDFVIQEYDVCREKTYFPDVLKSFDQTKFQKPKNLYNFLKQSPVEKKRFKFVWNNQNYPNWKNVNTRPMFYGVYRNSFEEFVKQEFPNMKPSDIKNKAYRQISERFSGDEWKQYEDLMYASVVNDSEDAKQWLMATHILSFIENHAKFENSKNKLTKLNFVIPPQDGNFCKSYTTTEMQTLVEIWPLLTDEQKNYFVFWKDSELTYRNERKLHLTCVYDANGSQGIKDFQKLFAEKNDMQMSQVKAKLRRISRPDAYKELMKYDMDKMEIIFWYKESAFMKDKIIYCPVSDVDLKNPIGLGENRSALGENRIMLRENKIRINDEYWAKIFPERDANNIRIIPEPLPNIWKGPDYTNDKPKLVISDIAVNLEN